MSEPSLTVIALTLNEERHLPGCLDSVSALDARVLVVDSGSTDRTLEIASSYAEEVVPSPFEGFASQRNRALDLARASDWVLFIDPDERLTPAGVDEIREAIRTTDESIAGFWIPRRNVMFGRELRGGGWWPDYQARLIRSGRGRYDTAREVHEVVIFDGETGYLSEPMLHINFESHREFLERQRLYTRLSAQSGMIPPPKPVSWVSRPLRELVRRYILLGGFRDGATGLFLAATMALEELRGCALARGSRRS